MRKKAKTQFTKKELMLLKELRKQSRLVKRLVEAGAKIPKTQKSEPANDANGHALIHRKGRNIVLATIREDRELVERMGEVLQAGESYRVGKVTVREAR